MRFAFGLLVLPLVGCHSLQDLDIEYRDCVEERQASYLEEFDESSTRPLRDSHCWKSDNEGNAPQGIDSKIFVEDGDLVMRVDDAQGAKDLDEWSGSEQAPMFYRRLAGDFLVVVRAEASTIAKADHCLPDSNRAGLVLRQSNDASTWATWTVNPFLWKHGTEQALCDEDDIETNNPTATVEIRSSNPAFVQTHWDDVGVDGEADLAICRVGSRVYYFYGKAVDATKNEWLPESDTASDAGTSDAGIADAAGVDSGSETNGLVSHSIGTGPLDVGLTVSGAKPDFLVAGHFNWIVFEQGVKADGCAGALEEFTLPEDN